MEPISIVDKIGLSGIAFWLIVSAYCVALGDGAMFARMGAVGTAVAVGYFAYIRHAFPYPVGLHQKLALVNESLNFQAQLAQDLYRTRTLLALDIKNSFIEKGEAVPPSISAFAENKIVELALNSPNFPLAGWEARNGELTHASLEADAEVSRVSFRAGKLQAWLVVVGTLQWGFGDIPFNYFHCGATTC